MQEPADAAGEFPADTLDYFGIGPEAVASLTMPGKGSRPAYIYRKPFEIDPFRKTIKAFILAITSNTE